MTTILVVDDDPVILETLSHSLKREGYEVNVTSCGGDALELFDRIDPDVVILDIVLPGMDGFEVCRRLRLRTGAPIIILTEKASEVDKILGLEIGADCYLPKPFSFRELLAHIHALLRRLELDKQPDANHVFHIGNLTVDIVGRRVLKHRQEVQLSSREYDLLHYLASQAGRACSRQELLDQVWGDNWPGDSRTLEVHIRWLRMKIEDDPTNPGFIQTVRGFGYRFVHADQLA